MSSGFLEKNKSEVLELTVTGKKGRIGKVKNEVRDEILWRM